MLLFFQLSRLFPYRLIFVSINYRRLIFIRSFFVDSVYGPSALRLDVLFQTKLKKKMNML